MRKSVKIKVLTAFKRAGITVTKRHLRQALDAAHTIKNGGVVIGLSKKAFEEMRYRSTQGSENQGEEGEVAIETPTGLDYRYIVGLEPFDQESFDFLTGLQRKHLSILRSKSKVAEIE